ncbi:MAG: CpsD/CapB family tyrosine-protein kinase, partial [Verrucomicrobia bacterium]|nr:CpsD/CapB family tyrosine-protein kinase [Verrucomicrobiota bacterium]
DEIVKEMRSRESTLKRQLGSLDKQIEEKQKEAIELGGKLAEHERLEEEFRATKLAHDQMFERVQKFHDFQNGQTDYVAIQEHASPAYKNVEDWIKPLLGGLVGGMLLGMIVLVLFDRLDDRMSSLTEVSQMFDEPVLAQVPKEKPQQRKGPLELLHPDDLRHGFLEAFRSIRSSLIYMSDTGQPPRTILVTSSEPNEGKSTTASNLAIVMASVGSRVLLVDADLRKGNLHKVFGQSAEPGLSEAMSQGLNWKDLVTQTAFGNLSFLPRGNPTHKSGEYFLTTAAQKFLKEVADSFDYVIVDSVPVLAADDVSTLAPHMDGVILVLRAEKTSARIARASLEMLARRRVRILGLVFNAVRQSSGDYYYYYKYKDYYKPYKAAGRAAAPGQA